MIVNFFPTGQERKKKQNSQQLCHKSLGNDKKKVHTRRIFSKVSFYALSRENIKHSHLLHEMRFNFPPFSVKMTCNNKRRNSLWNFKSVHFSLLCLQRKNSSQLFFSVRFCFISPFSTPFTAELLRIRENLRDAMPVIIVHSFVGRFLNSRKTKIQYI